MPQKSVSDELELFRQYLRSESSEDAKTPLLHPVFQKLFGEKFRIESDVHGADVYVAGQLIVESKTNHDQWLEGFYQAFQNFGLQDEPYFRYFDYPDFLTPYSGLIQIRKYAEIHGREDLQHLFKEISVLTKKVKEEIYRLLVEEFRYFE